MLRMNTTSFLIALFTVILTLHLQQFCLSYLTKNNVIVADEPISCTFSLTFSDVDFWVNLLALVIALLCVSNCAVVTAAPRQP